MRKSVLVAFAAGLIGAVLGVQITLQQIDETVLIPENAQIIQEDVHTVQLRDDKPYNTSLNTSVDLTFAAANTIENVVHIQTHFVTEEITFDPFLRLFYGEDGYRKRE